MGAWDGVERRSGVKRRHHRVYRFIDRRSGFDRRKRYLLLGTMRDHHWILLAVLIAMNVLSFVDGYFTAAELGLRIAAEGNPVLDAAARQHPLLAIAVKLTTPVLVSVGIWHGRRRRVILALAPIALVLFAALVAYHAGTLVGLGYL